MANVIDVNGLTKKYKELTAVDAVSFSVCEGEIFGFLGPNGAGKSTTIKMLSTIAQPTGGDATVNGFSIRARRDAVRQSIGLVFQDPSLDDRLTAEENLRFHARLYHVPSQAAVRRIRDVLELVELTERRKTLVRTFSGGMKRRLEIARGLIHYPKVLFLDEPTLGLDPQTRVHLWEYILRLKREQGMTIFMTTHYLNEAEYCDRIAIIDYGKIVALDTPATLKTNVGGDIIRFHTSRPEQMKQELLQRIRGNVREDNGTLSVEVSNGEHVLPQLLRELTVPVESVELRKPTLDDVFIKLTGRKIREEEASMRDRFSPAFRRRR